MDTGQKSRDKKHKPRKKPQARPDAPENTQTRFDNDGALIIGDELADTLDAIAKSETEDFFELCEIADINPLTDLAGADMRGVDISGKDFTGADLTHTDLREVKAVGTRLVNAKLADAELQNADFRGADLSGADLTGADITGADFSSAKITEEQLARANGVPAARPPVNAEQMRKMRRRRHPGLNGPG